MYGHVQLDKCVNYLIQASAISLIRSSRTLNCVAVAHRTLATINSLSLNKSFRIQFPTADCCRMRKHEKQKNIHDARARTNKTHCTFNLVNIRTMWMTASASERYNRWNAPRCDRCEACTRRTWLCIAARDHSHAKHRSHYILFCYLCLMNMQTGEESVRFCACVSFSE